MRRLRTAPSSPTALLEDEGQLRAAYDEHGAELYRFALRQLGDDGAAQDVVQEVFLRAWRSASSFDSDLASLRVWLFAIARNVVIDESRRARARPWQATVDPPRTESTTGAVRFDDASVDAWIVEEALGRLSEQHRVALVHIYLLGRPHNEVAAEQGIPLGTLRSRVFYGLKALRLALDEMGVQL